MNHKTVNEYSNAVAYYLSAEYDNINQMLMVNSEVAQVAGFVLAKCYEEKESVNNAAHHLLDFIRKNKNYDTNGR